MKSAYELAMEKLDAQGGPAKPLTDRQREALAEVTRKYEAKIAEREVFLKKQLDEARAQNQVDAENQLLQQIASERERLQEEMDLEKEKIRSGG